MENCFLYYHVETYWGLLAEFSAVNPMSHVGPRVPPGSPSHLLTVTVCGQSVHTCGFASFSESTASTLRDHRRLRSPEHTRPGEAAPGSTPHQQVAAFTPYQGMRRPTVPQASPLTSEHREPECVLGDQGRHRGPPWEAASPHECHTAWRAGTLVGGDPRGQRAAGGVLPRRDPHAPPGREARERTPHDPRASLCFRAVACKLAGHAHAQGSPDPQSSGCRELWPQRPATALSPRSSQRTSGRRERPQCSCSP